MAIPPTTKVVGILAIYSMKCPKCKSKNASRVGSFFSTMAECDNCGYTDLDAVFMGTGKKLFEIKAT